MTIILLSGSTGFIGGHLGKILVDQGYDVVCLNRFASNRRVHEFGQQIVYADLLDPSGLMKAVQNTKPHIMIHLAAVSPVAYSYTHQWEVNAANYQATSILAEACRELPNFEQFIFAGTSEAYGNQPEIPIHESAKYYPNSPYSDSKVAAIQYLEYMRDAYDFPMTVCLPFNTYGRINSKHFVTESLITQMLDNPKTVLFGDPKPVRDFLFRDDHVKAYTAVLENKVAIGEKFNFCTGVGVTIQELVDLLVEITGYQGIVSPYHYPRRPLDIDVLIGANYKAENLLGWTPDYDLKSGMEQTVDELRALKR